jgi:hypothetical protein
MSDIATSVIERLPNEGARAYAARVEYVTMGPGRSQEAVSQKLAKSRQLLSRWSVEYDWAATARAWDDQQAAAALDRASEEYQTALIDYRKRYGEMGKALLSVSAKLLTKLNRTIETFDLEPSALNLITNAVKTAADLEALALRIEHLLNESRSE